MQETIQQIRKQLRLAMNGVVSSSMRDKGMDYKMNFGVSVPKIKEIASQYEPSEALASLLWEQDVRELKIMATLLYPADAFTAEAANRWVSELKHLEIAEQLVANLLPKLPIAEALATQWITDTREFVSVTGYLLLARLCTLGNQLTDSTAGLMVNAARKCSGGGAFAQAACRQSCTETLWQTVANAGCIGFACDRRAASERRSRQTRNI